ncbi:MAG TPA: glutathione binding-like protein, partial [Nannocystis sp.]
AEGSAMTPLLLKLIFDRIPGQLPAIVRPVGRMICTGVKKKVVEPQLKNHFDYMENELVTHGPWFAGPEFTSADVQMSFPIEAGASRGGPDTERPKLKDFLERIHARPAYQRALERGGPYQLLR